MTTKSGAPTMSKDTSAEPAYVNLQNGPVRVYDENRVPVTVQPWVQRGRVAGVAFVVRGAHYQQFVSGSGPLYPFPGHPSELDSAAAQVAARGERHNSTQATRNDARMAALRGRDRFETRTVHEGQVIGKTDQEFVENLRRELAERGIKTAEAFAQAASAILLSCPCVTGANLPRVRESVKEIFPDGRMDTGRSASDNSPTPHDVPDPLPDDDPIDAPSLSDLDTVIGDDEDDGEDEGDEGETQEGYTQYARSSIEAMTIPQLKVVIEEEEFDIDLSLNKAELLDALLTGLVDFEMLTEE